MRKNKFLWILMAAVLLLTIAPAAAAAETGSLTVSGVEGEVCLYHVATPDAALTAPFAGAPVKSLTDSNEAVTNAGILWRYGQEQNIPGQRKTPDEEGSVSFDGLEEGLYLVGSAEEESEFDPFLVNIPTVINGETIYNVQAEPKQEEPTEPSEPTQPDDSTEPTEPEPEIPQTGVSVVPKYLLLIFGSVVTLAGLYDLIRGKGERHE